VASIPVDDFLQELSEIRTARRELREKDEWLARREAWIEQGIAYEQSEGRIQEIVPQPELFEDGSTRPTLRQAIVIVMRDSSPHRAWRPVEVIRELDGRGWLPEADSSHQMVRNRLASMVKAGEMTKQGSHYQLDPEVHATGILNPEES
jgi:hypothetical protein